MNRWLVSTIRIALLLTSLLAIGVASSAALATSHTSLLNPLPTATSILADTPSHVGAQVLVVAPALNVRNGPGATFDVIGKVYAGDRLVIIELPPRSAWLHVRLHNGTIAWVNQAWIRCCELSDILLQQTPTATRTALPTSLSATPQPSPKPIQEDQASANTSWFNVKPEAAAPWIIAQDAQDVWKWKAVQRERSGACATPKHVLVLYTKGSSAYDTAINTILKVFQEKQLQTEFTIINMRNDADEGQRALAWAVAEHTDLIFAMGSDATAFLTRHFQNEPIPVVSVSSKDPVLLGQMHDYTTGSGTNFAYTSLNMPIEVQMAYLHELKPELQNIAVLYAASNASAIQTQVKPLQQIAATQNIHVIDVVVNNDSQARAELAAKVPAAMTDIARTDPTYANSIIWITGSTSIFNEIGTINAHAGGVPVLSAVPDVVQEGDNSAVLSIGVSFQSNAHLAAVYATDILAGKARAGELKVGTVSPPDIAINFKRARAIGLKIPFHFFESASYVYDYAGNLVRKEGQVVHGR